MKQLITLLMCLQFIITPVAHAADQATGGALPGTEESTQEFISGVIGKSDPAQGAGLSDAYKKTGTGSKGGYDFYVNQIMTLATSSIGSSIISQCLEGLKTPSIAAFMAGSLTHIMSEILGAKAKNERHQKKRKDLEIKIEELKKSGDSAQLEALKVALQEEKDTHKFLENRKKWMIAVTAIYTAAMGLAIAEEVYGNASGLTAATAACSGYSAGCTVGAAACAAHCAGGVAGIVAEIKANSTMPQAREILTAGCAKYTPTPGCITHAQLYLNLVYGACQMQPVDGGVSMFSWGTLLSLAYGFGATKAGAGAGKIAQYGTMLIALLPLITQSFNKLVVQMYNFPIPRSITFGAAAVFSGTVTAGLASRANIAMQNVSKLTTAVNQFKVETQGPNSGLGLDMPGTGEIETNDPSKNAASVKNLKGIAKKECFSKSSKGSIELSSSGCANPLKIGKTKINNNFKLPAINHVSNLAGQMAEALANGDEAAAASMAGEIGSYAARVKAETDKLQQQYNEIEKKANRPGTDFDKGIKAQVAALQGEMNKAAASKGINIAEAGAATVGDEEPVKDESVPEVTTAAVPAAPEAAVDPLAGLNTDSTEEIPVEGVAAAKADQSLDDFESTVEDINKKQDVSIFKQLSNRYILNYTKIFEKKKVEVVTEEPKKN